MSSAQLRKIEEAEIIKQTEGALLMSTNISALLKAASVGLEKVINQSSDRKHVVVMSHT